MHYTLWQHLEEEERIVTRNRERGGEGGREGEKEIDKQIVRKQNRCACQDLPQTELVHSIGNQTQSLIWNLYNNSREMSSFQWCWEDICLALLKIFPHHWREHIIKACTMYMYSYTCKTHVTETHVMGYTCKTHVTGYTCYMFTCVVNTCYACNYTCTCTM